tara:strand:- start:865 stop:1602 length:738 start_codon:yes stop_codon:yes gene_type:complete
MRFLLDLIESDDITALDDAVRLAMCEIVKSKFEKRDAEILNIFEQEAAEDPTGTIEDPLLQPPEMVSKEYFFKRYRFGDHEIILKKVGMGQNAPTVSYIDGERYEVFTTARQAEKETQRYIKDGSFDKANQKKQADDDAAAKAKEDEENAADAAAKEEELKQETEHEKITESFQSIVDSDRPNIITFNDGDEKVITVTEAYHALEILKLLNNENGIKFLRSLSDSVTSYQDTMDFFLDRIRKGIY